jgi:hypothetical protein
VRFSDNQSKVTGRRLFLMMLATQPLIMSSILENPLKKIVLSTFQDDANDFFIIGGWILLKSDI